MSISLEKKSQLIKEYAVHDKDNGSVYVQCAILTERISNLTNHLKINKKDFSTRRGLLVLVGKRRKMLRYLKNNNVDFYYGLINKLNIRK